MGKDSTEKLEILRHSTSHVMALAVKQLFPGTKIAIGPPIEDGFYYDFDIPKRVVTEDLQKIEKKMRQIIQNNYKFEKIEKKREEAIKFFKNKKEDYKVEILNELSDEMVTIYKTGPFFDLCKGPHLNSTGEIKYFKLLSVTGAYWRGDENRQQLQRIYGTAFFTEKELKEYLSLLEKAKEIDHRKLGRRLGYFDIYSEYGAGLVFWLPKGVILREIIENYWKKIHKERGYQLVITPHIAKSELWKTSGHLQFYKEYMYSQTKMKEEEYIIRPMNCPAHVMIYKSQIRSYRDLPLRLCELGTVYRYERSGVLHGLLRVRGFTQDDAHIFTTFENLGDEIIEVLKLTFEILERFGFKEYEIRLSTKPERYIGSDRNWEIAESALEESMKKLGLHYEIDPGEGVFYGPKIDVKIKDCLKRLWQCSTIQIDFNLPQKFKLTYRDKNSREKIVVMIHRAIFGSLERFVGILLENYAGELPLWLAPIQVAVMNITTKQAGYATEVAKKLEEFGIRCRVDTEDETLNYKLRNAILEKIPYIVIVGKREESEEKISVRDKNKNLGLMKIEEFRDFLKSKI